MLRYTFIMLICSVFVLLPSCRVNNGDIGPLYGQWALRSLSIDGEASDIDCSLYYFRFQNNIVCITELLPDYDSCNYFGTWEMEAYTLSLNFTHTNSEGTSLSLSLPPELMIPNGEITAMHVITLNASQLLLSQVDDKGQTIKYTLQKLQ